MLKHGKKLLAELSNYDLSSKSKRVRNAKEFTRCSPIYYVRSFYSLHMPAIWCSWTFSCFIYVTRWWWLQWALAAVWSSTFPAGVARRVHNWFHIDSKSMKIETKHERTLRIEIHHVKGKMRCRKNPFDPLTQRQKWNNSDVCLLFMCWSFIVFFFFCNFNFSRFSSSTIDLNWNIFSSRAVFLGNNFSVFFCNFNCWAAREKKMGNVNTNGMKSDLLNSIGMRWNSHQRRQRRQRLKCWS